MKPLGFIVPDKTGISKYFEHGAPLKYEMLTHPKPEQAQQTPSEQKDPT